MYHTYTLPDSRRARTHATTGTRRYTTAGTAAVLPQVLPQVQPQVQTKSGSGLIKSQCGSVSPGSKGLAFDKQSASVSPTGQTRLMWKK